MSLRTRIWCTLLLVVVLPVGVCLYLMGAFAYDNAIRRAEVINNGRVRMTSKSLESHFSARNYFESGRIVGSADYDRLLSNLSEPNFAENLEKQRAVARDHWQELKDRDDPRMDWFYRGPYMQDFQTLQRDYPDVKDILIVDRNGFPVVGTEKPQSYDQSQEEWFKIGRGMNLDMMAKFWEKKGEHPGPRRVAMLIVNSDPRSNPQDVKAGLYVKVSCEFGLIFKDYLHTMVGDEFEGIITDHTGEVLAASEAFSQFAVGEALPPEWLPQAGDNGSSITTLKVVGRKQPELEYLVSRKTFGFEYGVGAIVFQGSTKESVVGPLRRKQLQLFGGTFLIIGLAAIAASIYMRRTISRPIEQVANITQELTAHSQYGQILEEEDVEKLVAPLRDVKTKDELHALADRFSQLSVKALGFQRILEHEVEVKTKLIKEDLEMAREFQQALLPHTCPECGCTQRHDRLSLEMAHFYQPAAFVSGDFYDYIPINDHQIAVLIGDVMGHGARSALVTAILRALIEDIRTTHTEPTAFLSELNQRYHEIIERSGQMVFVTACYLLFDTASGVVHGASAGHPLPLRASRDGTSVGHLLPESKPRFPLGMMEGVQYKAATVEILPDDLILLYTDGITEAESDVGQQFGENALSNQVAAHLAKPPQELVQNVAEMVHSHAMGRMQDDVCMVAVRVTDAA